MAQNLTEIGTTWTQPLTRVTMDKSANRTEVRPPAAVEITGEDGLLHGGVRPFRGFALAHEMQFQDDENHDERSVVLDAFPVHFRVGSDKYAFGVICRVERPDEAGTGDVFMDWWNSSTGWSYGDKLVSECSASAQMDVQVLGRLIYVFIAGRSPARIYVEEVCS